jgi:formyltetrahydrofolate synthetase
MEDFNLHLTGDIHAVQAANNLVRHNIIHCISYHADPVYFTSYSVQLN